MPEVMLRTSRRAAGSTADKPGVGARCVNTNWKPAGNRRAVCGESCKHGSGRGGRKRTSNGNALAAYSTIWTAEGWLYVYERELSRTFRARRHASEYEPYC